MANLDSETLKDYIDNMNKTIEIKEIRSQNELKLKEKSFQSMLDKSTIKDKKLTVLLEEQNKSEGAYKDRVDTLLSEYLKEKKLSDSEVI